MKLFTKEIEKQLQAEYGKYAKQEGLNDLKVICKIFNPCGLGTWYIMNQDPEDPDYLWGMAKAMDQSGTVELGSFSKSEFENIRINFCGHSFGLERDRFFTPMPASEVFSRLQEGQHI